MNFFETSDKKVIFDIDKIKMIIKNGNRLIIYLDGIKQYYVLSDDDSNQILEKLKDKIVPIYSTEEPTETPSEKPTEGPTEPSTNEPTTDESIVYCGATDFYLGADNQNEFNWPNENTIIHPDSIWELEEEGGARQLLNPYGSLNTLCIGVYESSNRIEILSTYDEGEIPHIRLIGIQSNINYTVHCSEPSSSTQLIHIN